MTVEILDENDIVTPDLYCRPLYHSQSYDDAYFETNDYGSPVNTFRWVPVTEFLGPSWYSAGISVKECTDAIGMLEFIKGQPPKSHIYKKD